MKKIYMLLVLSFTGLQSAFAQFIWHPDLGTPHVGAVSLSWDTRSYLFQVDDGEEFGSTGDIWDALDALKNIRYISSYKFSEKEVKINKKVWE